MKDRENESENMRKKFESSTELLQRKWKRNVHGGYHGCSDTMLGIMVQRRGEEMIESKLKINVD